MNKKAVSFEEGMDELEKIIEKLQDGELTLDSALAYFEKGVGLMRVCDEHLKKADGRLRELLAGENGTFVEKVIGVNLGSVLSGENNDA